MVMGYANKSFIDLMDWLYVRYGQITPGDLMQNQKDIQATYNTQDPIKTPFDKIKTGKEFAVAGNSPFFDQQLADMVCLKNSGNVVIYTCVSHVEEYCGR